MQYKTKKNIVFMGTPAFAVPSLNYLAKNHHVKAVYCQPSKPQGRGMKIRSHPVQKAAEEHGLQIETPTEFDDEEISKLAALKPDFLVVVAYGMILSQAVLDIPRFAAINGHASLLPRWRGAAPIQRAIAAGDEETGITAMLMERGLDSGAILAMQKTPISETDTAGNLHDRLAVLAAVTLAEAITKFDDITPLPQNIAEVTWAEKISTQEAQLVFSMPAETLARQVRAFDPFPGAWLALDPTGNRLKIKAVQVLKNYKGEAGQYIGRHTDGSPLIAAGDGAIALMQVQPSGKSSMSGKDFLNGNTLPPFITYIEKA